MNMKVMSAIVFISGAWLAGCGSGTEGSSSEVKTIYFPDGRAAVDDDNHTVRVTVPAGKLYRFTYSFHGDHHMGLTIYNETLDEKMVAHNWHNNSPQNYTYVTHRNTNKDMVYVIGGFAKGCWYNQDRCGKIGWFQERVSKTGDSSASFLAQQFNNAPTINVAWSVYE